MLEVQEEIVYGVSKFSYDEVIVQFVIFFIVGFEMIGNILSSMVYYLVIYLEV